MRKVGLLLLAVLIAAAGWAGHIQGAQAGRGGPGSLEFGFGATLNMDGLYFGDALALATDLPLDWLAISLPWTEYTEPVGSGQAWQRLDRVMTFAEHENLSILFQISSAPARMTGVDGPLPEETAAFVFDLVRRYPALQAVELFPHANTRAGWGKSPDPRAYLRLIRTVDARLKSAGREVLLVACGLKPLQQTRPGEEINDLEYLQALLAAAKDAPLPVISLDLSELQGDSLSGPETGVAVLRHYEPVRELMIQNSHQKSLIWINAFHAPSGTIGSPGNNLNDKDNGTTNWLYQAYTQMRSQLYIGVVFYQSLNPQASGDQSSPLIRNEHEYHPFYRILRDLIAQNAPEAGNIQKGRFKDELFKKRSP